MHMLVSDPLAATAQFNMGTANSVEFNWYLVLIASYLLGLSALASDLALGDWLFNARGQLCIKNQSEPFNWG